MRIDGRGYQSDICIGSRPTNQPPTQPAPPNPKQNPDDDHHRGRDTPSQHVPNDSSDRPDTTGQTVPAPTTPHKPSNPQPAPRPQPPSTPTPTPTPSKTLAPYTYRDADRDQLQPPDATLTVQPPGEQALINVPVIAYTTATPTTQQLQLRGHTVTTRLTPIRYDWHFGTHTHTTTHPGARYPHHTVFHIYREPGPTTITLTITWRIDYRTNHTAWRTAPTTIKTTTPNHPLQIVETTPHLVP